MAKALQLVQLITRAGHHHSNLHHPHHHHRHHITNRDHHHHILQPSSIQFRWLVNLHLETGGPYNLTVHHRSSPDPEIFAPKIPPPPLDLKQKVVEPTKESGATSSRWGG